MIHHAMILAAGLGTRFKPWTDRHPKALAPVKGNTLLQRNIEYLQRFGIYDVVVNVHHFAGQIVAAVQDNDGWGSRVTISDETDAVLETGGGLLKAEPFLEGAPFVLMNTDVLTDLNLGAMIVAHEQERVGPAAAISGAAGFPSSGPQTAGVNIPVPPISRSQVPASQTSGSETPRSQTDDTENSQFEAPAKTGRPLATLATTDRNSSRYLLFDQVNHLCGWKNIRTGEERIARRAEQQTPRAFSGIQVVEPRIFSLIRQQPQLRGKFSMIDVYLLLAATENICSYDHSDGFFIDVGRPEAIAIAEGLVGE